jgi:hypothetical protein
VLVAEGFRLVNVGANSQRALAVGPEHWSSFAAGARHLAAQFQKQASEDLRDVGQSDRSSIDIR